MRTLDDIKSEIKRLNEESLRIRYNILNIEIKNIDENISAMGKQRERLVDELIIVMDERLWRKC